GKAITAIAVVTGLWPVEFGLLQSWGETAHRAVATTDEFLPQLCFKLRASLSTKLANRRPRLRTNRHGPASTKYVRRMLSRVSTSGPTGLAECQVLSATANA